MKATAVLPLAAPSPLLASKPDLALSADSAHLHKLGDTHCPSLIQQATSP